MAKSVQSNVIPDNLPIKPDDATGKTRSPWGERIYQSLHGKTQAALAREIGISSSSLGEIMKSAMPGADTMLRIAQALDVPVAWLITGDMPGGGGGLISADEADWVIVPHYRLAEFTETGKPEPAETVPLRKDWLNRNARASSGLWLTELPPTTIEGLGEEGDTILCRDATMKEGEGTYLYFYEGMPLVRQFKVPKLGMAEAPGWGWEPDEPPGMRVVARILGAIKLRPF